MQSLTETAPIVNHIHQLVAHRLTQAPTARPLIPAQGRRYEMFTDGQFTAHLVQMFDRLYVTVTNVLVIATVQDAEDWQQFYAAESAAESAAPVVAQLVDGQWQMVELDARFAMFAPAIAEPTRQPDAIDRAAEGLLAEYHDHPRRADFAKRIANAVELVRAGQVEFPRYNTDFQFHGLYGRRTCQCKDAQYRGLSAKFGTACKHTLAMEIARRVEVEHDAVAVRRLIDKTERATRRVEVKAEAKVEVRPSTGSTRETALPASVDRRESLDEWLGYTPAPTVEEQMAETRRGLGAALAPGNHGRGFQDWRRW